MKAIKTVEIIKDEISIDICQKGTMNLRFSKDEYFEIYYDDLDKFLNIINGKIYSEQTVLNDTEDVSDELLLPKHYKISQKFELINSEYKTKCFKIIDKDDARFALEMNFNGKGELNLMTTIENIHLSKGTLTKMRKFLNGPITDNIKLNKGCTAEDDYMGLLDM